ncbi:ATP synthase regulation protein NCA2-domain-containing protein [Ochromonadaceae sp. CCMP2298]|nr:ATP synthase regulation protein NCA2-domain-containing protein [Ochromonadaceae sp. CCMP2298]
MRAIAGLSRENVIVVVQLLSQTGNKDLAVLFVDTIALIDTILSLVLREMFNTRKNILYWTDLASSPSWEILLYRLNSAIFKSIFMSNTKGLIILERSEEMLEHAELLRSDLTKLSVLLEKVNLAAALLKALFLHFGSIYPLHTELALKDGGEDGGEEGSVEGDDGSEGGREKREDASARRRAHVRQTAAAHLERCLLLLSRCFEEFLPSQLAAYAALSSAPSPAPSPHASLSASATADQSILAGQSLYPSSSNSALNPSAKCAGLDSAELLALFDGVEAFTDHLFCTRSRKCYNCYNYYFYCYYCCYYCYYYFCCCFCCFCCYYYWLHLTFPTPPTPTTDRAWVRWLLLAGLSGYSLSRLYTACFDGTLQALLTFAQNKLADHLYEPVTQLGRELFDTIRKRAHVVTGEELEDSRQALHRMLADFSKSRRGYLLILEDLRNSAAAAAQDAYTGKGGAKEAAAVAAIAGIGEMGGGLAGADATFSAEQAMDALMSEYEKELQTPVRGIMFGSLMSAILIQMQKLKVHTEAAMLTMDQILTSNELTITATAAMPAFGFIALLLVSLRKALRPPSSNRSNASYTEHFRLIMSDVERSLQEVHELAEDGRIDDLVPEMGQGGLGPGQGSGSGTKGQGQQQGQRVSIDTPLSMDEDMHMNNSGNWGSSGSPPPWQAPPMQYLGLPFASAARLLVARGLLRFNLVRLRSEFQALFEQGGGGGGKALSRGSRHRRRGPKLGVPFRRRVVSRSSFTFGSFNVGLGSLGGGGVGGLGSLGGLGLGGSEGVPEDPIQSIVALTQQESTFYATLRSLLRTLYTMAFGSNELLTHTTMYNSLHRDISLLESPDFEVSLQRKINTASRMRVSYHCLLPTHSK